MERIMDWPPALVVTRSACGALLLVVGSHGSGKFAAMTLGSVSRYAAVHAACPVVVVRCTVTRVGCSPTCQRPPTWWCSAGTA
jgi:nucleotide-binding universal stress UspA family protein